MCVSWVPSYEVPATVRLQTTVIPRMICCRMVRPCTYPWNLTVRSKLRWSVCEIQECSLVRRADRLLDHVTSSGCLGQHLTAGPSTTPQTLELQVPRSVQGRRRPPVHVRTYLPIDYEKLFLTERKACQLFLHRILSWPGHCLGLRYLCGNPRGSACIRCLT